MPLTLLVTGLGAAKTGLTTLGKDVGSVVSVHHHKRSHAVVASIRGSFTGHGYAKDYVDFCTSANASACIYVPNNSFAVYDSTNATIDDVDYFATQDDCSSGYGT